MRKTYKRMAVVGIAVALVVLISFPTNAITVGTSFKKLTGKKNLRDVASNVANNLLEKIKNRVVNRMNDGNRKLNSGNGVHICKMQARKTMATSNPLGKPLLYPMCTLNNRDNSSINITDVSARPQYADYNESVNITCNVASDDLTVDIVNVTISGPFGFYINISMNSSSDTKYYYNTSYNINGTYDYYIWAKNESTGNQSISDIYFFYAGNWPPQITNVGHDINDNFANISCTVTDNDDNDTDNVSTVKIFVSGNISGDLPESLMTNIDGTDIYYSNLSYDNDTYTYYIWANDTSGNINETTQKIFTIGEETVTKVVPITTDIFGRANDDIHPSVVSYGDTLLLAYENKDKISGHSDMFVRTSRDGGETWPDDSGDMMYWEIISNPNQTFPQLSIDDSQVLGTFEAKEDIGTIYKFEFSNINNFYNTADIAAWDYSEDGFKNFSKPDITYYEPKDDTPWIIGLIGSTDYTDNEVENSPMFIFPSIIPEERDAGYTYVTWFPGELPNNCSNISISYDPFIGNITAVCELENKSILFMTGYITDDENAPIDLSYQILNITDENAHPNVASNDVGTYILLQTEHNDDSDIVCYYSSDHGSNWDVSIVSSDIGISERYPIIYTTDTGVFCAFYKSGDLYLVNSADGVSWSEPELINDVNGAVVDDYHTFDIADSKHLVWTDSRNTEATGYDLYCAILGASPPPPPQKIDIYVEILKLENTKFDSIKGNKEFPIKNLLVLTIGNKGNKSAINPRIRINYTIEEDNGNLTDKTLTLERLVTIPGKTQMTINYGLFSCRLIDMLKSIMGFEDNGIMGSEGFKGLTRVRKLTVQLDPFGELDENVTSNNNDYLSVSAQDFNITPLNVITDGKVCGGTRFNVTLTDLSDEPVSGALIIYGSISNLEKIPVNRLRKFLKKVKIWKLKKLKFATKLMLKIVKMFLLSTCTVANHVGLTTTGPNGNACPKLKAPTVLFNYPKKPFETEKQLPLLIIAPNINCTWIESITIYSIIS